MYINYNIIDMWKNKLVAQGCSGFLEDTIINFCDNLEDSVLDRAMEQACQSDVILCLGTTLTVTPAASIVEQARGLRPLIICNRSVGSRPLITCNSSAGIDPLIICHRSVGSRPSSCATSQ